MGTVQALLGDASPLTTALSEELAVILNQCAVTDHNDGGTARTARELLDRAAALARVTRTRELVVDNQRIIARSKNPASSVGAGELPRELRELCRRGKIEQAAGHLRAVAAVVERGNPALARELRAKATDRRTLTAPVHGEPFCGSLLGCGVRMRAGGRDDRGFLHVTYALSLLYVPVLPLAGYLMDGRGVHARVPLGARARWWRRLVFTGLPVVLLLMMFSFPASLPVVCGLLFGLSTYRVKVREQRVRSWARWEAAR